MKKKILTCLLALLAVLTMMVPAWAEQTEDDIFIYDTAGLLNEDEWLELEMLADEISWRYRCAVYIVTVEDYEDYGSDPYDAAANIYNENDFGIGEGRDGILLLQAHGAEITACTSGTVMPTTWWANMPGTLLEDAFWATLPMTTIEAAMRIICPPAPTSLSGPPRGHPVRKPLIKVLPLALGIGLGLALLVCLMLKAKMKSVRQGAEADAYVTAEGLNLTEQYDHYTHYH